MSDLGTMEQRIADEMKRGELSATATPIRSAVVSAIQFYSTQRFPWNEFRDETHTTTADDPYVTISATLTIMSLDSVKIAINSRDYPLDEQPWSWMEGVDSGQYSGYPTDYAWYADQLRLYPIPSGVYTLKLAGIKDLTEVSAGAQTTASNGWMTGGEEMIRLHAKGQLFRDQLRAPVLAQTMFADSERARRQAQRRSFKLQGARVRAYL